MQVMLKIATDFSDTPGPRSREEGDFSGDEFREKLLEPRYLEARRSNAKLIIDLDGTVGYATSFLEAAFGGLARAYPISDVLATIELRCTDEPSLVQEVQQYIRDARVRRAA